MLIQLCKYLITFIFVFTSVSSYSAQDKTKCDLALSACSNLVKTQDTAITHLKENNKRLADALAEANDRSPTLPGWMWFVVGTAAGATAAIFLTR